MLIMQAKNIHLLQGHVFEKAIIDIGENKCCLELIHIVYLHARKGTDVLSAAIFNIYCLLKNNLKKLLILKCFELHCLLSNKLSVTFYEINFKN